MVYESDFYTTRRPYSRPNISSYTVSSEQNTSTSSTEVVVKESRAEMQGAEGSEKVQHDSSDSSADAKEIFSTKGSSGEASEHVTPRHYVVTDTPDRGRRAEENYSYAYSSERQSSSSSSATPSTYSSPYQSSTPSRNSYSVTSERVSRSAGGPGATSYSSTTERSSRSSDYPGSYHSSYTSTTSGRLPHGTTYRHFSYRV